MLKRSQSIVFACFVAILFIGLVNASNYTRIIGGHVTLIKKVPYLVNLRSRGSFFCGGTLVAPKIVITAAHCITGLRPRELTVVGGATYLSQRGVRRRAYKIIKPSNYNRNTLHMDIAVVKLSKPMRANNIRPIGLCNRLWKVGDRARVSGWGYVNENGGISNRVRSVQVPVLGKRACVRRYRNQAKLTRTMICASKTGKDACSGDSGGPLVYRGRLCGVVSWGIGCARQRYPGVYTSIRQTRSFLQKAFKA